MIGVLALHRAGRRVQVRSSLSLPPVIKPLAVRRQLRAQHHVGMDDRARRNSGNRPQFHQAISARRQHLRAAGIETDARQRAGVCGNLRDLAIRGGPEDELVSSVRRRSAECLRQRKLR